MNRVSAKWKWFGLGCLVSVVMAAVITSHLMSEKLAQLGGDPALELPLAMVAATSFMTFFGTVVPLIALVGMVVVIVDGFARGKTNRPEA